MKKRTDRSVRFFHEEVFGEIGMEIVMNYWLAAAN